MTAHNQLTHLLCACAILFLNALNAREPAKRPPQSRNFDLELPGKGGVITMIWCPPGTFTMGSPRNESGRREDETQHQVTLTKGFWLAETEVTQAQWTAVMKTNLKQLLKRQNLRFGELAGVGDGYPMYNVNFWEAQQFCKKVTQLARKNNKLPQGYLYRLPTEAQWEYACRAGTTTALNNGTELSDKLQCPHVAKVAWFKGNCANAGTTVGTQKVGQKQPNPWGFYDMHGNVAEWCADKADFDFQNELVSTTGTFQKDAETNPCATRGKDVIYRGGAWIFPATFCRAASRRCQKATTRGTHVGLRLALVPIEIRKK